MILPGSVISEIKLNNEALASQGTKQEKEKKRNEQKSKCQVGKSKSKQFLQHLQPLLNFRNSIL